ncbi:hypothetical protein SAMN04488066_106147 [Halorubrum aquaticum]|uniref:Uncharacterized protein n=1 Tax=Halorubrum aquaticum TaxID=387340 RepID=A0A1I3AMG2_9EURY|nr:hypothetical protein SAMN04488066_106147 [Halorubrum aquaticum]
MLSASVEPINFSNVYVLVIKIIRLIRVVGHTVGSGCIYSVTDRLTIVSKPCRCPSFTVVLVEIHLLVSIAGEQQISTIFRDIRENRLTIIFDNSLNLAVTVDGHDIILFVSVPILVEIQPVSGGSPSEWISSVAGDVPVTKSCFIS